MAIADIDRVYQAETLRTQQTEASILASIEIVQDIIARYPAEQANELSDNDRTLLLMAARILFTDQNMLAKRSRTGDRAVSRLLDTKETIVNLYLHPQIKKIAPRIKNELRGQPYDFINEMWRDIASYLLTTAALTGNEKSIDEAIILLAEVVSETIEPSLKALARFEQALLQCQKDVRKNGSHQQLLETAKQAIFMALQAKNYDRATAIAAKMYSEAAFQIRNLGIKGLAYVIQSGALVLATMLSPMSAKLTNPIEVAQIAIQQHGTMIKTFYKEYMKRFTTKRKINLWKRTLSPNTNLDDLYLPQLHSGR